jgi:PTS system fructose-specific IIA component
VWQESLSEQNIHLIDGATNPGGPLTAGVILSPMTVSNKWDLIASMHKALCIRENLDAALAAEIEKELIEREKLMSTGIGEQMAIPHAVIPGACRFMTECAIIKNGLDFDSIDGSKAYVVVMLVAPKSALQEHLKMMASIAQVFYRAETRQKVIAAATAAEALQIIRTAPHDAFTR